MRAAQAATALGALGFLAISLAVHAGLADGLDLAIDRWVVANVGATPTTALGYLSVPGAQFVAASATLVAGLLVWQAGHGRTALILVLVSLAGGLAVDGFKDVYDRPRPAAAKSLLVLAGNETAAPGWDLAIETRDAGGNRTVSNWTVLPPDLTLFPTLPARGYPSGHTLGATLSWGLAILLGTRRMRGAAWPPRPALAAAAAVALGVAAGRVLVRAHWASDVLASLSLGAAFIGLAFLLDDAFGAPPGDAPPAPRRV